MCISLNFGDPIVDSHMKVLPDIAEDAHEVKLIWFTFKWNKIKQKLVEKLLINRFFDDSQLLGLPKYSSNPVVDMWSQLLDFIEFLRSNGRQPS